MAIKITFICDKCGKTQDNNENMFFLAVGMVQASSSGLTYFSFTSTSNNVPRKGCWCKECCDKGGLGTSGPKVEAAVTLEDVINSMIEEAFDNRQ